MVEVNPALYQQQLDEKTERLTALLAPFSAPAVQVFASPSSHYRMRAEFRVWHEPEDLYFVMFDQRTKDKVRVDQFPVANTLINQLMTALLDAIRDVPVLRNKLFQVDFLTSSTQEAVISLLYHRQLDDEWQQAAWQLRAKLRQHAVVDIIGRARKQKRVLERDYVIERLEVDGHSRYYQQTENTFSQPNARINEKMLSWARAQSPSCQGDLLELYCGHGNFSLALADCYPQVLATELAKDSITSAKLNAQINGINNVAFARMPAEEVRDALSEASIWQKRGIDISQYQLGTLLVDPPRSGLDETTLALAQDFNDILYISCNPESLADNLQQLTQTHEIIASALFDQFPYTHHMEAGVHLRRKG